MESITSVPEYERVVRWRHLKRTPHGVQLSAETDADTPVEVALEFVLPEVLRFRMGPGQLGPARNHLLVCEDWTPTPFLVSEGADCLDLATRFLRVEVSRDPWRMRMLDVGGATICREASEAGQTGLDENAPTLADLGFLRDPETGRLQVHETFELAQHHRYCGRPGDVRI